MYGKNVAIYLNTQCIKRNCEYSTVAYISTCIKLTAFAGKPLFPIKFSKCSIQGSGCSGCDSSLKRKKL